MIERDEDSIYVGEVASLAVCYSQGEAIDKLMANMREVVEMCLEELEGDRANASTAPLESAIKGDRFWIG